MSVPDIVMKCKEWGWGALSSDMALFLIFIIMMVSSFYLGYLEGKGRETSKVEASEVVITSPEATVEESGVVASKSGIKYHLPWCSGAATIKEENKIYFDTPEAAEKAGYTKAGNCKGL